MEGGYGKVDARPLKSIIICLFTACRIHSHWWLHTFSRAAVSVPEVPVLKEAGCGRPVPHCCKHGPDVVCCRSGGVCGALLESGCMHPGGNKDWVLPGEQKHWCLGRDVTGRGLSLGLLSFFLWWLLVCAPPGAWAWTSEAGCTACWLEKMVRKGNMLLFLNLTELSTACPAKTWKGPSSVLTLYFWKMLRAFWEPGVPDYFLA